MRPSYTPYEAVAQLAQVFSSPERLRMVDLLAQRRRTVEELALAARISVKLTSHHLQILRREDIVSMKRNGRHVVYGLADELVAGFWLSLRGFVETRGTRLARERHRLGEVRRQRGLVEPQTAMEKVKNRQAFILDVRPQEEYETAHLPEAVSIPLEELHQRIEEIPKDRLVIAYCRGPYCEMADEAVLLLTSAGFEACRLEEGPLDWDRGGLPLEHGRSLFEN